MYSDASTGDENDDLYMVCCDLYEVAGEWLAAGAGLRLDDLLASVMALERLDQEVDMDMVERYGPLVSGEPTVRSVVDRVRAILRKHFSRRHLPEPALRALRDDLRAEMDDLQKAIGGLEARTADIDGIKRRIAMRNQIHHVSGLQKRIRGFANMLSSLHMLEWESSFSATRIHVTPKRGMVCRPVQSAIVQVEISAAAAVEVVIEGQRVVASIDGAVTLSVAGRPAIPSIEVSHVAIDRAKGVTVTGQGREIMLRKKGSKTDVQVKETA
jgi:hypothetical protein